jgi:acyl carrier protein
VLDSCKEPVPFGIAGELYIGGDGLARGYFRRPELTAEKFTIAPFKEAGRLYGTGDLVRRRRDGMIEFLGRSDFQVKVRGFRIELGEIEHALRQQPEIAECVVLLREDAGQKELVAYLVFHAGQTLAFAPLRRRLRERIPDYMVPAKTITLPALPRLPNGKLDRSKLPAPDRAQEQIDRSDRDVIHHLPVRATESAIATVFQDLLQTDRVEIDQSFFDLGAHSLLLVKAHERLRRELAPDLRLVSFFQFPTIAGLAAHIDQRRAAAGGTI